MIHPEYNENLNYPDLAVLEININQPLAGVPTMLMIKQFDAYFG